MRSSECDVRIAGLPKRHDWDLSLPLLYWDRHTPWTIGAACEGVQVFGSTGSGKTNAVLATLVQAKLRAGFGGLFLTAKPTDRAMYERWAREAGRSGDVMVFSPEHMLRYNFIDAELRQNDGGGGLVSNLTALLMTVIELSERTGGDGGRDGDAYWRRAAMQLARNAVQVLVLGREPVTIPNLHRFISSAPASLEQVAAQSWQEQSFCFRALSAAERSPMTPSQRADLELALSYFLCEWAGLASRTKSVVVSSLTSATDMLSRGAARDLLSSPTTNVTPEMCQDGAIVIADLPTLVYHDVGRLIQVILKFCWQRASGRRDVSRNPRPVFIVADEAHLLAVSADQLFQTTARSSRTSVIYVTQSMSNYLEAFGERAEPRVHSLLGNLQTKLFCQQTDARTIAYTQELTGRSRQLMASGSAASDGDWLSALLGLGQRGGSAGFSETYEYELQASDLNRLRTGGPPDWMADAILHQGGKRFKRTGRSWMQASFRLRV